jgi:tetratricopeptide (TPR) repeat protein
MCLLKGGGAMAQSAVDAGVRYWAFVSYSHRDAAFGRWLHRRLEGYRLPQRLLGRATTQGRVPARLVPIFRDREELAAASDLSAEVRTALAQSRSLVVVCSPAAVASPWVSREVQLFRALHPGRPILAALYQGEPGSSFPAALRDGSDGGDVVEPLAADFRSDRDGNTLGLLKLVAGIAGVGLDELVQRDAQRRARRVTAVTAASLAGLLAMGALTAYAFSARTEAEHQRSKAEGLVEYMLTDLRDKLKGVGRLDVMTAVNERALDYYSDQNLSELSVDSLERRARLLHAMGEDDEARGNHDVALAKFREALRTTAALLAEAPGDPERIYDHAQSEYWVGLVDYNRKRFAAAQTAFVAYKELADRLVKIAPDNARYRAEVGYADSNLCALSIETQTGTQAAISYCRDSLEETEHAFRGHAPNERTTEDLIERHAWLADAYRYHGDYGAAEKERVTEKDMLQQLISRDEKNMDLKYTWMSLQIALGEIDHETGRDAEANAALTRALKAADALLQFDPTNKDWKDQRDYVGRELKTWNAPAAKTGGTPK